MAEYHPDVLHTLGKTPLAIEPRALGRILAVIAGRQEPAAVRAGGPQVVGETAVIPIAGPIFRHASPLFEAIFGATSVDSIRAALRAAASAAGVQSILLAIDSPGGEVAGIADLADEIAATAQQKPMTAVADPSMYSAAYWLGSATGRVILPRDGGVGSVGVLAVHVDESQLLDNMGLKVTVLKSGARKDQFSSLQPLSDQARGELQAQVTQLAGTFFAAVAGYRGLSPDAVRAFEGGTFTGQAAVDAGLADGIGTTESTLQAMQRPTRVTRRMRAEKGQNDMADDHASGTPIPEPSPAPTPVVVAVDEKKIADLAQARERKRNGAIMNLCALAGKAAKAAEYINSDLDLEAISEQLLKAAAADAGPELDAAQPVAAQRPVLTYEEIYARRREAVARAQGKVT
jgi:signal peptide peptidase SppA